MSTDLKDEETTAFCSNEEISTATEIPNIEHKNNSISCNATARLAVITVLIMVLLIFMTIEIISILQATEKDSDIQSEGIKIESPERWQIIIGNKTLTEQEIVADILVIPTKLSQNQSLILIHQLDVELDGFNDSNTSNLTIIPDTILELNQNYSIRKVLTNKNETHNIALYAFTYFYENCFDECGAHCGILVDLQYSMYCNHEYLENGRNETIAMKISLLNELPHDSILSDVSYNILHQMLSNYYHSDTTQVHTHSAFCSYFDSNIYYEQDWQRFSWSMDDDNDEYQHIWNTNSNKTKKNNGRRNLQSLSDIIDSLPSNFEDDVLNVISSLLDDTLWVEACGFLLDGCDYYQSSVASGSFNRWYLGKYSYGVNDLCVKIKGLPYIASNAIKNANSTTGLLELEVGLKQHDPKVPAAQASFHAYISQKLCVGLIFFEWCYRSVTNTVDVEFEINPSFKLDLLYGITIDNTTENNTNLQFILQVGLDKITTTLQKCDIDVDFNDDRSLLDYFSYLIPFVNILPIAFDNTLNVVQYLVELMDDNICPLLIQYAQQYISDQIDKFLNNNGEYLTLLNVENTNIAINNGLIYLYKNIWLNSNYDYSLHFEISDICTEILMDCLSKQEILNDIFTTYIPKDRGSNNAHSIWNTDCNPDNNNKTVPKAIVSLWDDDDGFDDIDHIKCGAYIDMLTCDYSDNTWINIMDCYTLDKNDGGSKNPYIRWDTQCNDNYLMTAIYDTDDGFNDINNWKCCSIETQKYAIDYNECHVVELGGNTDGGTTEHDAIWRAQCKYNYFAIAMYDDDDNFADVDAMKCCSVNKL